MLPSTQPSSPSLKQSREKAFSLLIQLASLFLLFIAIASFMLIVLSNFGLNFIDTNVHPIIPKHHREQIAQQSWSDRSTNSHTKNHGVLYCPLKYDNLFEEVAETWHSTRNYYECPVPMGSTTASDNEASSFGSDSFWNFAGQSGISRVVCCENNRCCTTHQWMDFTLFYSIMSRYAPWPMILLIVMFLTTFLTVAILVCSWHTLSLLRKLFCRSTVPESLSSMSPTLSEIDPLYLGQCHTDNLDDTVKILTVNNNNNNGVSVPSGSSSNGSSTGSQSTAMTGCLAEMHSRTNSSLSMSTNPPQIGRFGHVSLMTPPHLGQTSMNCNLLPSFEHQNTINMINNMSLARNSMSFQPLNHGQPVPNPSFLPSPTEVPKVNLATTFQWQNNTSRHYESVNAHNLNPITNDII